MPYTIHKAVFVTAEPGDGTHYEFIIADGLYKPENYITIVSGSPSIPFRASPYKRDDIAMFFNDNPEIDGDIPVEIYRDMISRVIKKKPGLIGYVCDHSKCLECTAIAALTAARKILVFQMLE